MIKHLVMSVGKILEKLEKKGIAENTIVIFRSDNGGIIVGKENENFTTNFPLKGQKANVYEGGIRVPLIISYKGHVEPGKWWNVPVDCSNLYPTLLELTEQKKQRIKLTVKALHDF